MDEANKPPTPPEPQEGPQAAGRGLRPAVWIPLLVVGMLALTWLFHAHPPLHL